MTEQPARGGFFRDGPAEVAVVIVSYNSADDIEALLPDLRREATTTRMRVIVADNSSADDTLGRLRSHDDIVAIPTGGNLGYAGAINVAMAHVGETESILILNPDLRLDPGAVPRMLRRLRSDPRIGAVVPLLRDAHGEVYESLRREPGVLRATADALLGRRWRKRPAALSEYVRDPRAYAWAHPADWATGAALLISARAAASVGAWDERFFLYSEETDYQHRLRASGWAIWFDPAAAATHRQGGSGVTDDLTALTIVNRVRYMDKHAPRRAGLFRAALIVGEQLRRGDASHDRARWALARRSRWAQLPRAVPDTASLADFPTASVVIPAHNESNVIEHTLLNLAPLALAERLEVIVVCNGCTDDTAARARAIPGIRVVETDTASKTAALNLGDEHATRWPRVYLDADIDVPPAALEPLIQTLAGGDALAGRPSFRTDLEGASALVRSYHRARGRMPSTSGALWGAGVYALSRSGHDRLGSFPEVTADDLYIDQLFTTHEKALPATVPVVVSAPRRSRALLDVLARARRGPAEQGVDTSSSSLAELVRTVRGPLSALDAAVYAVFALVARRRAARAARSGAPAWERDDTTRAAKSGGSGPGASGRALTVDHVLLTRFNLPTQGPESLVRAREGWLRDRVALFERYTVPSVTRQTVRDFSWIVYLDPQSPQWLLDRLEPHVRAGVFTPLMRESVDWQDVARDARELTGGRGDVLLTTNLDNDDGLADDFVDRLQALARLHRSAALYLGRGLIVQGDSLYLRRDDENAFCSVVESWDDPQTAWRDWHTLLHEHFPVVTEHGAPGWLQVVHGGNVSNRVRGLRVSPAGYRARFGDLLDDAADPSPGTVAIDRLVRSPLRAARENVRAVGKNVVLHAVGKDGLDRIKERLRAG